MARMAPLALIAALLLALVPTASRIIASVAPAAQPILMELCTGAGTHTIDVSPFIAVEDPRPVATASSMTGEACGYCALLPPFALLLLSVVAWLPRTPRATPLHFVAPFLRWPRNLRGLGSQAPPIAL
ncbi:MAG: DUF2946 family protein [Luteimonas sp.]|nr:DUF2946 family protein [Luteimonas sp.]